MKPPRVSSSDPRRSPRMWSTSSATVIWRSLPRGDPRELETDHHIVAAAEDVRCRQPLDLPGGQIHPPELIGDAAEDPVDVALPRGGHIEERVSANQVRHEQPPRAWMHVRADRLPAELAHPAGVLPSWPPHAGDPAAERGGEGRISTLRRIRRRGGEQV